MNPNSAHQQWSEWMFAVEVPGVVGPALADITLPFGRFFAALMGRAGRIKIDQAINPARRHTVWTITVQIEGESVFAPGWRAHVLQAFTLAAQRRFGERVRVTMDVRLLAGQTEDGAPAAQWLMLPTIVEQGTLMGAGAAPAQTLGMAAIPASSQMRFGA